MRRYSMCHDSHQRLSGPVVPSMFSRYPATMHPPPFRPDHHLSDWPDCRLELWCCKGTVGYPDKLLIQRNGDRTFAEVLNRLRCSACGGKPAPVYLCAGHREHGNGAPPYWAVELVGERR